jgi:hypothetical protein
MKITDRKSLTRLVVLGVVIVGAWWALSRTTGIISPKAAIAEARSRAINQTFSVQAGYEHTYAVEFRNIPGRLSGHWSSQGKSAGIKGATDDSLVAFKLIGPNNNTLHNLDHQNGGNFDVRIDSPGRYTFAFDNSGIIRSSARNVSLDATYQPD